MRGVGGFKSLQQKRATRSRPEICRVALRPCTPWEEIVHAESGHTVGLRSTVHHSLETRHGVIEIGILHFPKLCPEHPQVAATLLLAHLARAVDRVLRPFVEQP